MGYSISVSVKNKKLGQKMIDFLKANAKSWDAMVADHGGKCEREPWEYGPFWADGKGDKDSKERGGLSYIERRGHIGFDYGWAREYKYTLLRWMATKIGKPDPKTGLPRYLYDDGEWVLVHPEEFKLGILTDNALDKIQESYPGVNPVFEIEAHLTLTEFRKEMKSLDDLWEEET